VYGTGNGNKIQHKAAELIGFFTLGHGTKKQDETGACKKNKKEISYMKHCPHTGQAAGKKCFCIVKKKYINQKKKNEADHGQYDLFLNVYFAHNTAFFVLV
jgi:hypothetical protein